MTVSPDGVSRMLRLKQAEQQGPEQLHIEQATQAREWIAPSDFSEEPDLATVAFLPYRYMSPYERTEAFYQAYRTRYNHSMERRTGRKSKLAATIAELESGMFTSMWRARQRADALGVPYKRFVIAFFDDADARGTDYPSAPNQMCSDDKLPMVMKALDALQAAGRMDPFEGQIDPRFYAVNFVGDAQQLAALDRIEAEVMAAGKAVRAKKLAYYMRVLQVIGEDEAVSRFGSELVEVAKSEHAGWTSIGPVQLDNPTPSPPPCIGTFQAARADCMQCPYKGSCEGLSERVEASIMERYGATDVPKQRKREKDRLRQQDHRRRKKEGVTMTRQERNRLLREGGNLQLTKRRLEKQGRRNAKKAAKQGAQAPQAEP